jgi:hypothetical protein
MKEWKKARKKQERKQILNVYHSVIVRCRQAYFVVCPLLFRHKQNTAIYISTHKLEQMQRIFSSRTQSGRYVKFTSQLYYEDKNTWRILRLH